MANTKRECEKCQGVMYRNQIAHDESIELCWQCANCGLTKKITPRISKKRKEKRAQIEALIKSLQPAAHQ